MDGELPPDDTKTIRAHLLVCRSCDAEYRSLLFSYNLVGNIQLIDSQPAAWTVIENRIRTAREKRGFLRRLLFPNIWVPVGALGTLVLVAASVFWFIPSQNKSDTQAMQQILRSYIQERNREFGDGAVRVVNYNPFRDNNRRPKGNPFKTE